MSDPTSTPVDKSAEPPIRDEIRRLTHGVAELRESLGPLADSVRDIPGLVHRLHDISTDKILARLAKDRKEDADRLNELFSKERIDRDKAIAASELRIREDIVRIDERIDGLSLNVGAAFTEHADDVSKVTNMAEKNAKDVALFTRGRMGFGLGSAAIALAAKSGFTWADVKAWAWSHGLLLTVGALVLVAAAAVEITARLRKKGQS